MGSTPRRVLLVAPLQLALDHVLPITVLIAARPPPTNRRPLAVPVLLPRANEPPKGGLGTNVFVEEGGERARMFQRRAVLVVDRPWRHAVTRLRQGGWLGTSAPAAPTLWSSHPCPAPSCPLTHPACSRPLPAGPDGPTDLIFVANKSIEAGEEIFIDYGLTYDRSDYRRP